MTACPPEESNSWAQAAPSSARACSEVRSMRSSVSPSRELRQPVKVTWLPANDAWAPMGAAQPPSRAQRNARSMDAAIDESGWSNCATTFFKSARPCKPTTLMMLPIALSVLSKINLDDHPRFPVALLLGTAYAANLGGIATLVGTPPNVAMAGLVEEVGLEVPFLEWSMMALPFSALMLALVYVLLTRVLCRVSSEPLEGGAEALQSELEAMGGWSPAERRVAWVFGATALLWVARRALVTHLGMPLNDTTIAMAAGVVLFILPSGSEREGALLAWSDTARLPWDILLLFGGGLTLAGQLSDAGVLDAVAQWVSSAPAMSPGMLIAGFVLVSLFLTEVMSNLALTVVMVPVVAQIALSWDMNPLLLVVPVTMASSCAFMLPMATPPNAIVFGSGRLRMATMVRVGVVLNLAAAAMAWLWACWVLPSWVQLL